MSKLSPDWATLTSVITTIFMLQACGTKVDFRSERSDGAERGFFATTEDRKNFDMPVLGEARGNISFEQRDSDNRATFRLKLPDVKFDEARGVIFEDGKQQGREFAIKEGPGKYTSVVLPTGRDFRVYAHLYNRGDYVGRGQSPRLAVGDIFLVAGQSNSANAGDGHTESKSGGAFMFTGTKWKEAADPFRTADFTSGSSPWPHFGDFYFKKTGVPAAIVSLGWSATTISQWQPGNASGLNARLQLYAKTFGKKRFRAILWHQGESDVFAGTSDWKYRSDLQTLIASVRQATGWPELPWFVANTSYIGVQGWQDLCKSLGGKATCKAEIAKRQSNVRKGQTSTVQNTFNVFQGADSDELQGPTYRAYQNNSYIHFNPDGQYHHAWRWSEAVTKQIPRIK